MARDPSCAGVVHEGREAPQLWMILGMAVRRQSHNRLLHLAELLMYQGEAARGLRDVQITSEGALPYEDSCNFGCGLC